MEKDKLSVILPNHQYLYYTGRVDFINPLVPVFVFPYTSIEFSFIGTMVAITILNKQSYWDNYLGVVIDGKQYKIKLEKCFVQQTIIVAKNLDYGEHKIKIFKRQDSCHLFQLINIYLSENGKLLKMENEYDRRMEFYGDSITAGEVSEAVEYEGCLDPNHQGEFSNSWYSYSTIAARSLKAEVHLVAQGGIGLLDKTGYFNAPDYIGMESIYNLCQYNRALGEVTPWDFTRFIAHVVVVAIGQNDAHPINIMKEDYDSEASFRWRKKYMDFISILRGHYKKSIIILQTTILEHDESWDKAIKEVCRQLEDPKIYYFGYKRNGKGTPGHLRIKEAEEMAEELVRFINSLGENIWKNKS